MKRLLAVVMVAVAGSAGCGAVDGGATSSAAEPPDTAPYITGAVTTVAPFEPITDNCVEPDPDAEPDDTVSSDDPPICSDPDSPLLGSVLVEEQPDVQHGGIKISFRVEEDALVLIEGGGTHEQASFSDLTEGQRVSAWTSGPVADSYPGQGTADVILIHLAD